MLAAIGRTSRQINGYPRGVRKIVALSDGEFGERLAIQEQTVEMVLDHDASEGAPVGWTQ